MVCDGLVVLCVASSKVVCNGLMVLLSSKVVCNGLLIRHDFWRNMAQPFAIVEC